MSGAILVCIWIYCKTEILPSTVLSCCIFLWRYSSDALSQSFLSHALQPLLNTSKSRTLPLSIEMKVTTTFREECPLRCHVPSNVTVQSVMAFFFFSFSKVLCCTCHSSICKGQRCVMQIAGAFGMLPLSLVGACSSHHKSFPMSENPFSIVRIAVMKRALASKDPRFWPRLMSVRPYV